MRLFTYTIPIDDGAAPNPFHGMCSLAICKPGIRRVAKPNDWVAGLGSKNAPSGDLSYHLVYAMRVQKVLSLKKYDLWSNLIWPYRIPDIRSADPIKRLGDCIYDFSNVSIKQRLSVHDQSNMKTDLNGENALISYDFYYFGNRAIPLPPYLQDICHHNQGHRSDANNPFVDKFVSWLRSSKYKPGQMYGWPDYFINFDNESSCNGCQIRKTDGENDIAC